MGPKQIAILTYPGREQDPQRVLILPAFAALKAPLSRAYYDRKPAEGKRHNQALIALARRRCGTLYAMLKDGTLYQEPKPGNLASAA